MGYISKHMHSKLLIICIMQLKSFSRVKDFWEAVGREGTTLPELRILLGSKVDRTSTSQYTADRANVSNAYI